VQRGGDKTSGDYKELEKEARRLCTRVRWYVVRRRDGRERRRRSDGALKAQEGRHKGHGTSVRDGRLSQVDSGSKRALT